MTRLGTETSPLTTMFTRVSRLLADRLERTVAEFGFSLDQWLVVDALAREDGLSMSELADRTQVSGPTLSRVVDRLATEAYLYRQVAAEDRRRAVVRLAQRGRGAYERARAEVDVLESELLGDLDPAQRQFIERLGAELEG